jgi:hypothetical protein
MKRMFGPERHCQACGALLQIEGPIGRRDACEACGVDLHTCVQCRFYDVGASDQCREPEAERIQYKEQQNFCEYFQLATGKGGGGGKSPADEAKAKLEALFKK